MLGSSDVVSLDAHQSKTGQVSMVRNCQGSAEYVIVPYSTYYKPMGDLPYISSEQGGGLIIHHGFIMRITIVI